MPLAGRVRSGYPKGMRAPDAPPSAPEDSRKFVARGVAHVTLPKVTEPVSVAFVLVPKFTMLAFTSAIEPLRVANQLTGQILFRWQTFSEDGQPVIKIGRAHV